MSGRAGEPGPIARGSSSFARPAAVLGWAVIAAVMVRIGWGGWPGGVWFVLGVEPAVGVVIGVLLLVVAIGLVVALALGLGRDRWRVSAVGAALALSYGLFLVADGHDSGGLISTVAIVLLPISVIRALIPDPPAEAATER